MPRFHVPLALAAGARIALPPGAARHVQVLRLQPGLGITLFDGRGGEWPTHITTLTGVSPDQLSSADWLF